MYNNNKHLSYTREYINMNIVIIYEHVFLLYEMMYNGNNYFSLYKSVCICTNNKHFFCT